MKASSTSAVKDALAADRLADALALATERVRAQPADGAARLLMIDLLVLSGDYERADRQADAAAKLSPPDAVGLGLLRGQIRGLHARDAWFRDGAVPSFPGGPTKADEAALRLGLALRENDATGVRAAADALEAAREAHALSWNGAAAPDFRDADDRLPHAFEAVTGGGSYLWIDFARVDSLAFEPARVSRDLALRRATLTLRDGSAAEILVPAIYGTASELPDALRLGRQTEWVDLAGGLTGGMGQRCFLVGEELQALSEAQRIEAVTEGVGG